MLKPTPGGDAASKLGTHRESAGPGLAQRVEQGRDRLVAGKQSKSASDMTPQQAQDTIRRYQSVLAADDRRGSRRDPSLLPTTKANVMKAIKIEIAQLHYIGSATDELLQPLIRSAMFLDSFTHDSLDTAGFVSAMQQRRAELEEFHHELLNIPRDAAYYWQRTYALMGLKDETKYETFFDTVKRKFGMNPKETATGRTTTTRIPAGRIELD